MSEFTFEDQTTEDVEKPVCLIYGPEGVGKTTLAASATSPIWVQTEKGQGEHKLRTIKKGVFESYEEVLAGITHIGKNISDAETLVIDSLDELEPLVWDKVCRDNGFKSIEAPGYGRGYVEADKYWRELIQLVLKIRDRKDMTVILLAHDLVKTVNDPTAEPYDSHTIKLHKRATALWKQSVDMIGLLRTPVVVSGDNRKAKGGSEPTLFPTKNAAYEAKTRYSSMPSRIPIPKENGWNVVAQYIPALQN